MLARHNRLSGQSRGAWGRQGGVGHTPTGGREVRALGCILNVRVLEMQLLNDVCDIGGPRVDGAAARPMVLE